MKNKKEIEANYNEDKMMLLVSEMKKKLASIYLGGGKEKIKKHKKKGKLTARERINYLIDDPKQSIEIGAFAADKMYEDYGGCPSAGVIVIMGYVSNKQCIIVANDATVKAGSWFPMTGKKNLRAQEIAIENKLPIIYLVDSAGVFLPLQNKIFPDKEHFGRIFRNNAIMSSMGIIQISAIMGSCVAGGAYLPIMSDESLIVKQTGSIFLAGSYLVKSAIGENIDNETLGGANTHCEISGVTDYKYKDDKTCLDGIKEIFDKISIPINGQFNRIDSKPTLKNKKCIYNIVPENRESPYDGKDLIKNIIDEGKFQEYKTNYGKSLICGYARIDGWAVGIVANQRQVVKSGNGEMQIGGVIYSDSADKAARFIMNCNQKKIPLVFFQDVTGFMVGSRAEHGGIIKDGAKMVNAVANSVVPKFTVIVGNSYGAGNYAMCGKAYDPRLIIAWPTAKIAVMGGAQAANTLLQIEKASYKSKKKRLSKEEEDQLLQEITSRFNNQTTPYYAASRLWVDAIIDPIDTRKWISMGIKAANNAPIEKKFNLGLLQT